MEVEKYKMIYTTKIKKELKDKIDYLFIKQKVKDEMLNDNIRILGHDFVKNNKNKAKLIINNKKYGLKESANKKKFTNDKIKINMILSKDISNISHMFKNCVKLLEISIDDDFININDEKFYKFEEYLDYNIENNEDINEDYYEDNYINFYNDNDNIFSNCSERKYMDINHSNSTISDIKDNIIIHQYNYYSNMSEIFYNCLSLLSLPDISKWNTNNVNNMSYMFYNCSSLSSLPDISKWNTNNVKDMSYMFSGCEILNTLPDISKWNISSINNMNNMFENCKSLTSIPDISKWDVSMDKNEKNINISCMFSGCSKSLVIPNKFKMQ